MANNPSELYKKIAGLKDLTSAIKEVKKTLPSNKKPKEVAVAKKSEDIEKKPEHGLKYLSRNKMINGVLSHLIGTGNDGDNHYQVAVNLEKYHKKMPSVNISVISPKGEVLDNSPENYKNMKDAIKGLVGHNMKKAWK